MKTQHVIVKTSTAGELVVKSQRLGYIQENKKWYWELKQKQQAIVVPSHTIVHQYIDVMAVKYVQDIPRSICNRNQ